MKFSRFYTLLLFSAALLSACSDSQEKASSAPPEYPVIEVQPASYTGTKKYPAMVEGMQNIEIRAKVNGYLQSILVDEGQAVKQGTPLFKLETASLSQDAAAAQSAVEAARSKVRSAQLEVDKVKPLVEKGVVGEVQLETAQANLSSAEAQLQQTRSNYHSVTANVGYADILSPVDGVVGKINFREGSLVGPNTAKALTTVANISKVFAYFSLNESEFLQLTRELEGATLQEKLQQLPAVEFIMANDSVYAPKGQVTTATGNIDPATGAIQMRAVFENPDGLLRNGSSGSVLIPQNYEKSIAVPALSTFERQGKRLVYLLTTGDTLRSRSVEVADEIGPYYVLRKGLKPGDQILAKGVGSLKPGAVIQPRLTPMDSVANSFSTVFK